MSILVIIVCHYQLQLLTGSVNSERSLKEPSKLSEEDKHLPDKKDVKPVTNVEEFVPEDNDVDDFLNEVLDAPNSKYAKALFSESPESLAINYV